MGSIIGQLCAETALPKMFRVKQQFDKGRIEPDVIPAAVKAELSRSGLGDPIKSGMKIAITCGSRGVANIPVITKAIADFVKSKGAIPFVVPAMGSHGGATAEGQTALLAGYGVTEASVGCPIVSSMETVVIGKNDDGNDVRIDKNAAGADGIIVAGRIKPHTDFRGTHESGLMKMMTIGLGKREGADICHDAGFAHMPRMVPMIARHILKNAKISLGLAILENAYGETCKFVSLRRDEIDEKEPALLEEARSHLPLILFKEADVLIIDKIGKDISGDGMDPNVTGATHCSPFVTGGLKAQRTVVLDLSQATHGAALGIGAAHTITRRLFDKIDYESTYVNAITARNLDFIRIPIVLETDREAIQLALRTCVSIDRVNPRIIRIEDSLHTETIWISEVMRKEAEKNPKLTILEEAGPWPFDSKGNLF